jgi:hypothetical protein
MRAAYACVVYIESDSVPEDHQLQQRREEQQETHARLAERLDEFLS